MSSSVIKEEESERGLPHGDMTGKWMRKQDWKQEIDDDPSGQCVCVCVIIIVSAEYVFWFGNFYVTVFNCRSYIVQDLYQNL